MNFCGGKLPHASKKDSEIEVSVPATHVLRSNAGPLLPSAGEGEGEGEEEEEGEESKASSRWRCSLEEQSELMAAPLSSVVVCKQRAETKTTKTTKLEVIQTTTTGQTIRNSTRPKIVIKCIQTEIQYPS